MKIPDHRTWMHNRLKPCKKGYTEDFLRGVEEFISFACQQPAFSSDGNKIRCPCSKHKNRKYLTPTEVRVDLYKKGFRPHYWYWTSHGEHKLKENGGVDIDYVASSSVQLVHNQHLPGNRKSARRGRPRKQILSSTSHQTSLIPHLSASTTTTPIPIIIPPPSTVIPSPPVTIPAPSTIIAPPSHSRKENGGVDIDNVASSNVQSGINRYLQNSGKSARRGRPRKQIPSISHQTPLPPHFCASTIIKPTSVTFPAPSTIIPCPPVAIPAPSTIFGPPSSSPKESREVDIDYVASSSVQSGHNQHLQGNRKSAKRGRPRKQMLPSISHRTPLPPHVSASPVITSTPITIPAPSTVIPPPLVTIPAPSTVVTPPSSSPLVVRNISPPLVHTTSSPTSSASQNANGEKDAKILLELDGEGFLPSREAANGIVAIIKRHYKEAYISWKKIPPSVRDIWFKEFHYKYEFFPPNEHLARINFEKCGSTRLKSLLGSARKINQKPPWMVDVVWEELCTHWRGSEYREKCRKAKRNRSFVSGRHTCGSITASQHKQNIAKKTGLVPTVDQLFKVTHLRKDGSWIDNKAQQTYETFDSARQEIQSSNVAKGSHRSSPSEMDIWVQTVGGKKKGRIYGLGSEATVLTGRHSTYSSMQTSSSWMQALEFQQQLRSSVSTMTSELHAQLERERCELKAQVERERLELQAQVERERREKDELLQRLDRNESQLARTNMMMEQLLHKLGLKPSTSQPSPAASDSSDDDYDTTDDGC